MALSQKHRTVLYEHFADQLGVEVSEALLAEFPARDDDELVTRQFLRAELAELRAEMHRLQNRTIGILIAAMGVMTAVLALVVGLAG